MTDEARRGYAMLARLFLLVGAVGTLLALLQMAGVLSFFHGNPLGVALLVLVIGVLLWWTVRTAPAAAGEQDDVLEHETDDDQGPPP